MKVLSLAMPPNSAIVLAFVGKLIRGIKNIAKKAAPLVGKIAKAAAPILRRK